MAQAEPVVSGSFTLNYLSSQMFSTDDDDAWNSFGGFSGEGYLRFEFPSGLILTTDISGLYRDLSPYGNPVTEYRDQGPREYRVLGLHAGKQFGDIYAGGFAAVGYQQTDLNYNILRPGFIAGIEGKRDIGAFTLFGQLAYMDWRYASWAAQPTPDNGFTGMMARIGTTYQINDRLSAMFDFEYGYSGGYFEDYTGWGEAMVGQIQVAYAMNDSWDLLAGYEYGQFRANTEDDGYESNITLGVRYNFGGARGFNALSTPVQGFAAAGWAKTTD